MTAARIIAIAALAAGSELTATAAGAQSLTTLQSFTGLEQYAGLLSYGGSLYGTTQDQGSFGNGSVYRIDPSSGAETLLYSFSGGSDGGDPVQTLIYANGTFYGTTAAGGANNTGTVFKFDPATGVETVLYSFGGISDRSDGNFPFGQLMYYNGKLYGTTTMGGASNCGTIYEVDPATGAETVLASFTRTEGKHPSSNIVYLKGALYGVAEEGGNTSLSAGTLFKLTLKTNALTVVHYFSDKKNDGAAPLGGLINVNGTLYGTTGAGFGNAAGGTVFKLDPATGAETVLHAFTGGADGSLPCDAMIYVNGMLYGTTQFGGPTDTGTLFQIDPATGAETVMYSFTGGADGGHAFAGLTYLNGDFYGTTENDFNGGTVFRFVP